MFAAPFLRISFTPVGVQGGCPAEKDNDGCFFLAEERTLRPPEKKLKKKEFCDCEFEWSFSGQGTHGVSQGKTLPAFPTEPVVQYHKLPFTMENAAAIPCEQVLGTYIVTFER